MAEARYMLRKHQGEYLVWDTELGQLHAGPLEVRDALDMLNALNAPHRPSWAEVWMGVAQTIATRSRCDRRKIGAVIVDVTNQVQGASYNGPPAGMPVAGSCVEWCQRAQRTLLADGPAVPATPMVYHDCPSIHAESNVLLRADRSKIQGGTIYVTGAVCMDCAKLVANSGLATVVMDVHVDDAHREPKRVAQYLVDCGLVVKIKNDTHEENDEHE